MAVWTIPEFWHTSGRSQSPRLRLRLYALYATDEASSSVPVRADQTASEARSGSDMVLIHAPGTKV